MKQYLSFMFWIEDIVLWYEFQALLTCKTWLKNNIMLVLDILFKQSIVVSKPTLHLIKWSFRFRIASTFLRWELIVSQNIGIKFIFSGNQWADFAPYCNISFVLFQSEKFTVNVFNNYVWWKTTRKLHEQKNQFD